MEQRILQLIEKESPDVVLIEDVVLMRSPAVMKMLARLQGIIIGYCDAAGIPIEIYFPTAWRKLLDFKQAKTPRKELKQQAIDLVMQRYGIAVNSDEADAICIALAHFKKQTEENENVEKN